MKAHSYRRITTPHSPSLKVRRFLRLSVTLDRILSRSAVLLASFGGAEGLSGRVTASAMCHSIKRISRARRQPCNDIHSEAMTCGNIIRGPHPVSD
jgi:hypothetical protein